MTELGGFKKHKTTHQDAGDDEISVEGLAGVLSEEQKSNFTKLTAPLATKTADYTITSSDFIILANGTVTITLPTPVGISGRLYVIKNIHASLVATIATSAGLIDGIATQTLTAQYESVTVVSDGTNWNII